MHYEWTPAEEAAEQLDIRRNAMIYPLKDATKALEASRLQTSVAEQQRYVQDILGSSVSVQK